MARDRRGLEDIVKADNTNGFETPDPEPIPETPKPKNRTYPSREGKKPIQFHVSKDAHRQVSIVGAEKDMTTQDIMIEALNAWFVVHDLPPIA